MRGRLGSGIANAILFLCAVLAAPMAAQAQGVPLPVEELPLAKDIGVPSGQTVTPVYEGWYQNPDGTYSIVFGYYSRNGEEVLHVPLGPDNEVTGAAQVIGQPTDFEPGRHWGVFAARVPSDFDGEVLWTLKDRGRTFEIPGGLNPLWKVDAITGDAMGNFPPEIRFQESGPTGQGPAGIEADPLSAQVGAPLEITVWGKDDGVAEALGASTTSSRPFQVRWTKQSGPAPVTFSKSEADIPVEGGMASTTATFEAPGDYVLRVTANDASGVVGGGHAQCCWTNGFVKVSVSEGSRRAQ
ncbi:MAG: hypothetical protein PVJ80_12450 [Gemmatimonadota bacterium]